MPKLIVKIDLGLDDRYTPAQLRAEIERDRANPGDDGWFSPEDGDRILVDDAYLRRSNADDSFFACEFVGVEE